MTTTTAFTTGNRGRGDMLQQLANKQMQQTSAPILRLRRKRARS
jgi:hypothetical protein